MGFAPVSKVKFNENFAPKDWNYKLHGKPDIIFMVYNSKFLIKNFEKIDQKELHQIIKNKISNLSYSKDYDEAQKIQMERCKNS